MLPLTLPGSRCMGSIVALSVLTIWSNEGPEKQLKVEDGRGMRGSQYSNIEAIYFRCSFDQLHVECLTQKASTHIYQLTN